MGIWNRKKRTEEPILDTPQEQQAKIEIEVHKDAKKEIVDKANEVQAHLNELLVQNGFIVKIVLAAKSPQKQPTRKGGK